MKAVRYESYGDPDVLKVVETDVPHAGPDQIRIAVRAAGVNAIDWKVRAGHMRDMMPLSLPAGTGLDASGIVDEVGDGVAGVAVGDAVFGTGSDTYAEHAVLTDWAPKPDDLPFAEAAGYPVAVSTAQRILDLVGLAPGQTVLVSGAAGGVGSAAVQFARTLGAHVIGTASPGNQSYLEELGATPTTYGEGLVDRVRVLAPDGVDAALDIAGSGVIPELIELTGDPSKVVSIADFTAGEHGAQVSGTEVDRAAKLAKAVRHFDAGTLRIRVANAFALHDAPAAHRKSQSGHVAGRTVIVLG